MPVPTTHPHRKMFSSVITGGESGYWTPLGVDCLFPPEGGKLVGFITEAGDDLGKLGLVNGTNTSGKVYGFAHVSVNPNQTQIGVHARALTPDYNYPAKQEVFVISDATATFRIKVGTGAKSIADIVAGKSYSVKIESGEQVLDPDSTSGPVTVEDCITDSGKNFVRISINASAR